MKLNTFERLLLLNILPKEGNIAIIKIVHDLRQMLSFTENEHEALQITFEENGSVKWKSEADIEKDYDFGVKATEIIINTLKELDNQKKLTEQHLSLWDKFITS